MLWIPICDVCSPAFADCTAVNVQCASDFFHRVANCVHLDADFSECAAVYVECAPCCTESVACCAQCVAIHVVSSLHFYRTRPGVGGVCPVCVRCVAVCVERSPNYVVRDACRTECSLECMNRDASFTTPAAVFVHSVSTCVHSVSTFMQLVSTFMQLDSPFAVNVSCATRVENSWNK